MTIESSSSLQLSRERFSSPVGEFIWYKTIRDVGRLVDSGLGTADHLSSANLPPAPTL